MSATSLWNLATRSLTFIEASSDMAATLYDEIDLLGVLFLSMTIGLTGYFLAAKSVAYLVTFLILAIGSLEKLKSKGEGL